MPAFIDLSFSRTSRVVTQHSGGSPLSPLGRELVGDGYWIVMLPDVNHGPTSFATIDAFSEAKSYEHDVWPSWEISDMQSKSQTWPMKGPPKREFRTCIPRSWPSHGRAHGLGRCGGPLGLSHLGVA